MSTLKFGIPSLDRLFVSDSTSNEIGIQVSDNEAASIVISGGPGSGKSLLGLHLATEFLSSTGTRVIYASADYSEEQANKVVSDFYLGNPNRAADPIYAPTLAPAPCSRRFVPLNDKGFLDQTAQLNYLRINSKSGDIWHRLSTLLSLVTTSGPITTLLVLDGLEGFASRPQLDEFGVHAYQRERMEELIGECAKKAHCLFILECYRDQGYLPEEYCAGTAMRIAVEYEKAYARRYIEIVKCRSQVHLRGRHTMLIRAKNNSPSPDLRDYPEAVHSYIQVVPSIDALDTRIRSFGGVA